MTSHNRKLDSDNIQELLKELGKRIRKEFGKNADIELIIVGGASILLNYGFRETTTDIDAAIRTRSSIKSITMQMADKYDLGDNWLNDDFKKTSSYSDKIDLYSKYYKTYSGVLHVRTVSDIYLLAMKLDSFRVYKNDLSDIVNIYKNMPQKCTLDDIEKAYGDLYGDRPIDINALNLVGKCIKDIDSIDIEKIRMIENNNQDILKESPDNDTVRKIDKETASILFTDNDKELVNLKEKIRLAKEKAEENKKYTNNLTTEISSYDK